jgi:hypothetical protein
VLVVLVQLVVQVAPQVRVHLVQLVVRVARVVQERSGMQTRYGVPANDLAWEISRNQAMMPGLSRSAVSVGY